jgi:hypothetical protein
MSVWSVFVLRSGGNNMFWKYGIRLTAIGLALVLFVAFAPPAGALGPTPNGTYSITFYNYVSEEGGAACPYGGNIPASGEGALNTFHFWPEYTSPYPGVGVANYTVCWDGYLTFPQSGTWYVQTINDDGMDIWVDGNITMQAWYDQGPTYHQGSTYIDASYAHHVIIKYYNRTLGATACVGWGLNGQSAAYWACPNSVPQVYANPYNPYGQYPNGQYSNGQYPYGQYSNGQFLCGQYPYGPCPVAPAPSYPQYPQPQYPNYNPIPPSYGRTCTYVVQPGDTLAVIAARYGMNYSVLAQYNRLYNPSLIYSGMVLNIPNCR